MADKVTLEFPEIARRLKQCALPEVDRVVGIGSGGVVPAALVAFELNRPLTIVSINYRAPDNSPRFDHPKILSSNIEIPPDDKYLLLVDDVSVSGKTLAMAKQLLVDYQITTLVMKGTADIVLFPEVTQCVNWPWHGAT